LPLIGILNSGTEQLRPDQFDGLHRGLKETGFVAGTNVTVISRGADDNYDRLPALAAEFVRLPVAGSQPLAGRWRRSRPRQRLRPSRLCSPLSPIRSRAA
jgi:hypothetical protein